MNHSRTSRVAADAVRSQMPDSSDAEVRCSGRRRVADLPSLSKIWAPALNQTGSWKLTPFCDSSSGKMHPKAPNIAHLAWMTSISLRTNSTIQSSFTMRRAAAMHDANSSQAAMQAEQPPI